MNGFGNLGSDKPAQAAALNEKPPEDDGPSDRLSQLLAEEATVELVEYSCHPIQKLIIGEFVFENGMMRLKPDRAETFDKLLATLPPRQQVEIHKLADEAAKAEALAKQYLATTRTRGVDTSTSGQKPK